MTSSIKENPRLRAAAEELHKAGVKVGDAVSEALKTMEESDLMRAVHTPSVLSDIAHSRLYTDLPRVRRSILHDRKDDRADPEHAGVQNPRGDRDRCAGRQREREARGVRGEGGAAEAARVAAGEGGAGQHGGRAGDEGEPGRGAGDGAPQGLAAAGGVEPAQGDEPAVTPVCGLARGVRRVGAPARRVRPVRDTDGRVVV